MFLGSRKTCQEGNVPPASADVHSDGISHRPVTSLKLVLPNIHPLYLIIYITQLHSQKVFWYVELGINLHLFNKNRPTFIVPLFKKIFVLFVGCGQAESTCSTGHCGPVVPVPDDGSEYKTRDGKRIGRVNRSNRRKPPPVPCELPRIEPESPQWEAFSSLKMFHWMWSTPQPSSFIHRRNIRSCSWKNSLR